MIAKGYDAPCHKCPARVSLCHAGCMAYQKWSVEAQRTDHKVSDADAFLAEGRCRGYKPTTKGRAAK